MTWGHHSQAHPSKIPDSCWWTTPSNYLGYGLVFQPMRVNPLSFTACVRPERFELSPCSLRTSYATITPEAHWWLSVSTSMLTFKWHYYFRRSTNPKFTSRGSHHRIMLFNFSTGTLCLPTARVFRPLSGTAIYYKLTTAGVYDQIRTGEPLSHSQSVDASTSYTMCSLPSSTPASQVRPPTDGSILSNQPKYQQNNQHYRKDSS